MKAIMVTIEDGGPTTAVELQTAGPVNMQDIARAIHTASVLGATKINRCQCELCAPLFAAIDETRSRFEALLKGGHELPPKALHS